MTKSDYAGLKDWNKSYLSKKSVKARIAPAMVGDLIDADIADEIFKTTTDTAKVRKSQPKIQPPNDSVEPGTAPPPTGAPEPGSMDHIRRQQAQAQLDKQLLDLAERKGQTLPRAETMAAVAAAGTALREHLQSRNRRLAEQASTMKDAREIKAMLDADDRAMLEMISHDFMRRVSGEEEGAGEPTVN